MNPKKVDWDEERNTWQVIKDKLKSLNKTLIRIDNLVLTFFIYYLGVGLSCVLWKASKHSKNTDSEIEYKDSHWKAADEIEEDPELYKKLY